MPPIIHSKFLNRKLLIAFAILFASLLLYAARPGQNAEDAPDKCDSSRFCNHELKAGFLAPFDSTEGSNICVVANVEWWNATHYVTLCIPDTTGEARVTFKMPENSQLIEVFPKSAQWKVSGTNVFLTLPKSSAKNRYLRMVMVASFPGSQSISRSTVELPRVVECNFPKSNFAVEYLCARSRPGGWQFGELGD